MTKERTYYCCIQYCPDRCRAEALNVGVVVYCPGYQYLGCKMTDDYSRLEKIFPIVPQNLKITLDGFANRLQYENFPDLESLEHFIDSRANDIRMTSPRVARKRGDLDQQLQDMFVELVQ